MKKLILILSFIFLITNLNADTPHFIDFTKVLNESSAGKKAQESLKKKFKSESERFKKIEEDLKKEETQLISKKKIMKEEEFKKSIVDLRKKVQKLQKDKQNSINQLATSRAKAKKELLNKLNPIMKKYMEDNKIRVVLDKKNILLGDKTLEITSQIMEILNKEVKSITIK